MVLMPIAIDVIERSLNQTTAFFRGPNLFGKWAKFALIVLIFSLFTGSGINAGFDFNSGDFSRFGDVIEPSGTGIDSVVNRYSETVAGMPANSPATGMVMLPYLGETDAQMIFALAAVLVAVVIIICFVLRIIGNAALFAAITACEKNDVRLGLISQNLGRGLNLTVLQFLLFLMELPFLIMLVIAVLGAALIFIRWATPGLEAFVVSMFPWITDTSLLVVLGITGFLGVLFFAVICYFLNQFGIYLMYRKGMGAFTSLREGISLAFSRPPELLFLIAAQIALGVVIGVISAVVGIIILIPMILVFGVLVLIGLGSLSNTLVLALLGAIALAALIAFSYIAAFALSPVYVFIFRYNLNVLDGFMKK